MSRWLRILSDRFPTLLVVMAVMILFLPFFFQGKHLVPFHFEPGRVTAIPGGGDPAIIDHNFSWDASPVLLHYPNATLAGRALRRGHLPTWNPCQGCGTPALGSGQVYPFSPFLWLFYLFPNPWIYTFGLLLGCLWGALGVNMWLKRLGLDKWSRVFAVSLTVINPWSVRNIVYSDIWAGWWFGWLLWSWEVALEPEERRWWLPSVMIAGTVYSGHPETALLLTAGSFLYAIVAWTARSKDNRSGAFWIKAAGTASLAGLMTAVHWLPVLHVFLEAYPYKLALPQISVSVSHGLSKLITPRSDVYLNPILWGLCLIGLSMATRTRWLWAPIIVLMATVVFLFHPLPFESLYWVLTLGGIIPAFYGRCLFFFSLAPIAAVGAGKLVSARNDGEQRRVVLLLCLGVLSAPAILLWDAVRGGNLLRLVRPDWLIFNGVLLLLALAAVLTRHRLPKRWALALLIALVVLDPFVLAHGYLQRTTPFAFIRNLSEPHFSFFNRLDPLKGGPPAIEKARSILEKSHGRFWSPSPPSGGSAPCLGPNMATLWNLRDVRIQDVLLLQRYVVLQQAFWPKGRHEYFTLLAFAGGTERTLGLLGVQVAGIPLDENSGRFRWVTIPDALPRAFLMHSVASSVNEADSFRKWKDLLNRGLLHNKVVLEGWSGAANIGQPNPGDKVTWIEDDPERIRLKVHASSPAVMVLLDTYADGWKAIMDGRETHMFPADLAFRAVIVNGGDHRVEFKYAPHAVREGLLLTVAGWLALLLLAGVSKPRPDKKDDEGA